MDTRKDDQSNAATPEHAGNAPQKTESRSGPRGSAPDIVARLDTAEFDDAQPDIARLDIARLDVPAMPSAQQVTGAPLMPQRLAPALMTPDRPIFATRDAAETGAPCDGGLRLRGPARTAAMSAWARRWAQRLAPFAATIAVAAAVGALTGSIATVGWGTLQAAQPTASLDAGPVRDAIARVNADLVALKAAVDTSGKGSNSQFAKLGDRLDRVERAQAERAARLAKLTDAVGRLERRAPAAPSAANDVTGSVASATPAMPAAASTRPEGSPVLSGWVVRSVYDGIALIEDRMGSAVEVEPGDYLPGLGRIESIRRHDGHWVVVTSKGLIAAR